MFPSNDNKLAIAELPSDIIRHIIRVGQESMEGMRLISHRWNIFGIEHLSDRKRLPPIALVQMYIESGTENFHSFNIQIPDRFLAYFGVLNQEQIRFNYKTNIIALHHLFGIVVMRERWFEKRIAMLFDRCSSIAKFDFGVTNFVGKEVNVEKIKIIMGDVTVHELHFTFHNFTSQSVSNILCIIQALSVYRIVLNFQSYGQQSIEHLRSVFNLFVALLPEALNSVDAVDFTTKESAGDVFDEPSAHVAWTKLAEKLSKEANVAVAFNMKKEGNVSFHMTLSARKHVEL